MSEERTTHKIAPVDLKALIRYVIRNYDIGDVPEVLAGTISESIAAAQERAALAEAERNIHLEDREVIALQRDAYAAENARLRAEREALMTGLGLDPSDECRDEYPPERLHSEAYAALWRAERSETEVERLRRVEAAARAVIADVDRVSEAWGGDGAEVYPDLRAALKAVES